MKIKLFTRKQNFQPILVIAVLLVLTGISKLGWGQTVGDYQTRVTGTWNWNTVANWQRCVTNGTWTGATSTSYPGQNAGT
ncbi:MAG: hypothetical protein Q7U54_16815, partial [Bacteroidales bacterium]|nr:hypothetical protein [Bacteroidales bacterium]